jgi:D-3-phosphoglycerate dehydrogenase / 2-oxoglutarate reductase
VSPVTILNAEPEGYSPVAKAQLEALGTVRDGPFERSALEDAVSDCDVLITRLGHRIDAPLLAGAPRLRAVVSATTGLDHIDVDAAVAHGIAVLSLRGERGFLDQVTATAELTWGLLLALTRRIPAASRAATAGAWDRDAFRGHDIAGKRLGIVGLGRLGRIVADYGRAFRMTVAAYDPQTDAWPAQVGQSESLEALLAQSDVVSLHLPLSRETTGLIDAKALATLPEGAILLNTSRGAIIDEGALLAALESGRLAGAALDVLADETAVAASPLLAFAEHDERLLITPHIGGATHEAMERTEIFMAEKLARHLGSDA